MNVVSPQNFSSQVTQYKPLEHQTIAQGTSGPPTATADNVPIQAMYSHMSIQRGTGSIETTSKDELIVDPKLQASQAENGAVVIDQAAV